MADNQGGSRKMILNTKPQHSDWEPLSVGNLTAPHTALGASLCYRMVMQLVILMTPDYKAKLKLWSACSLKNVLGVLIRISS